MEWISIVGFILFGIILIVIEIIFVPGTTIVGIGGFLLGTYGIYLSYSAFGYTTGNLTAFCAVISAFIAIVISFKSKMWEKFSLQGKIESRNNDDIQLKLNVGDEGESVSSLKPMGKASFNDQEVEVSSLGGFISEKQKLKIVKIEHAKIFVEQLN